MNDLVVYGAGGQGRETLEIIEEINRKRAAWRVLGFVDDGAAAGGVVCGYPLLGGFDFLLSHAGSLAVVLAFADCAAKRAMYEKIKSNCPNTHFPVIIHPGSYVSPRAQLAEGAVVTRFCSVHADAKIGKCVLVNNKSEVCHDSVIGDFCSLMPAVNISGNVTVGDGVFIGVQSAVRQGVTIGGGAVVGMGSMVLKDVPRGCMVAGVPAKIITRPPRGENETAEYRKGLA